MRDPKTHAKVLALRARAVSREWRAADQVRAIRLWRLFHRLSAISIRHERATGWTYCPTESGGAPGKWLHTEIDTEEEA